MDFHSLTRKELQTLCKKNRIPANLTNVAMADALASLHRVEGLEEFLEESKSESQQLPEEAVIGSPNVPRTTCRTSTRRKLISKEPESSQILTRTQRTMRRGVTEEGDHERTEVVPKTPAAPSSRRRAPPVSARQKTESQKEESSVQRAYSTRRSVRLLEKTMEELSLAENRKIQPLKIDELSKEETANGASLTMSGTNMQTSSEVRSEKTEDFEVFSALKSDGSSDIRTDMNNDVLEKKENHVTELEFSKSKSEIPDSVEKPDENVDVVDKTFGDQEIDSVENETQNPRSEDSKAEQVLATEDSLAVEISDDVSTAVIAQEFSDDISTDIISQNVTPKASITLEENEFSFVNKSVEHVPLSLSSSCVEAENLKNLSSEVSALPENIKSSKSDLLVTEDDYQGNFDFESDSITGEENGGDSSGEESVDSEASDENLSKFLEHISDNKVESEEKETSAVDINAVESEIVVAEDGNQGKHNFESESVSEEESGADISEDESVESEASVDDSVEINATDEEFTDSENVDTDNAESEETDLEAAESEEKETSAVDINAVESETVVAEDGNQGKHDFESESVTEEESVDDISEDESVESEASDDEFVASDASDEEFTESENVNDHNAESEETDLEASLVDVDVTEGEVAAKTLSQSIPCHVDDATMLDSSSSGALVAACVVAAEEFTTITSEHLPKSQPSLKETSPANHMVSGSNVTTKSPLPTFSADQLSGQFPRPTLPLPCKSSSKRHLIIQMVTDVLDEHEENVAVAGGDEVKKNENPEDDNSSMPKLYEGTSLRQLQKMLREKMQIENEKKAGKTRIALQTLPENRMAADETQKGELNAL